MAKYHKMRGPFTKSELRDIAVMYRNGYSVRTIAKKYKSTENCIRQKIHQLRESGETGLYRKTVMSFPNGGKVVWNDTLDGWGNGSSDHLLGMHAKYCRYCKQVSAQIEDTVKPGWLTRLLNTVTSRRK